MSEWKAENAAMRARGMSCLGRSKEIQKRYFATKTVDAVRSMVRRDDDRAAIKAGKQTAQQQGAEDATIYKKVYGLIKVGATTGQVAQMLGVSARVADTLIEDLRADGYNILTAGGVHTLNKVAVATENIIREEWNGDRVIRFGVVADCHINNKCTQITFLHKLYDIFQREGINTVYNAGDIDDGEKMHKGHEYELYNHGADEHVAEIVRVYPQRSGIETQFITGNHDLSYIKLIGLDIGDRIAQQRPDMRYLGREDAKVYITENCCLELLHPGGGTAYAISYKPQKIVESMSGGEKPNILIVGHFHKAEWLFYRNVHILQGGCTEAQTQFMRSKQLAAMMGGFIVEVRVHDDGSIDEIQYRFFPFYKAIGNDYMNWRDFNRA